MTTNSSGDVKVGKVVGPSQFALYLLSSYLLPTLYDTWTAAAPWPAIPMAIRITPKMNHTGLAVLPKSRSVCSNNTASGQSSSLGHANIPLGSKHPH